MNPDDANFNADKQANFPSALSPYFFYLIMVHDQVASGAPRTVTDASTAVDITHTDVGLGCLGAS